MHGEWETLKEKGNEEFKKQNYNAAVSLYSDAIAKNSNEETLYANRALCHKALGKYKQAINDLNSALKLNPRNTKNLKRLAGVHVTMGNYGEAEILLQKCVNLEPRDYSHSSELSSVKEKIKNLDSINEFQTKEDWSRVEELCSKLLKDSPGFTSLKPIYVEALLQNVKINEAINYLSQKVTADERHNSDEFDYLLALALYYDGKYDKAKKILGLVLQKTNDNHKYNHLWKLLKDIDKLKDKANDLFKAGKYDDAINEYTKILEFDPSNKVFNAVILSNRALCYQKLNKTMDALKDVNKAIGLNPNYNKAYFRRGSIYMALKMFEEAKYDFQKVKEMDPSNKDAQRLWEEANREAKKAKKRDYYKILEVSKDATPEDIKKAYRKLALKWHPDRHSESEESKKMAEKMFIDINDAYTVLSDPKKKQMYDSGVDPHNPEEAQGFEGGMGGHGGMHFGGDPSEIFKVFFGGPGGDNMFFSSSGGPGGFGGPGGPGGPGGFSNFFSQAGGGRRGQNAGSRKQDNPFEFFFNQR